MNQRPASALPKAPGLPTVGRRQHARPPRVCIATSDLLGPIRNGGVGTACATLAAALADAGHEVTLLYVGPFESGDAAHWRASYAARHIIFHVPEASAIPLDGTPHARASYLAYEWLKQQPPFDVIQFPEINGVGFYSLQARRLGVAFQQTYCCVVLHSPTLWHRTENREHVDQPDDLALEFMERESVARADALVAPTHYLLAWASRWGFRFPREVYVQPYVSHTAPHHRPTGPRQASELVFFGRLESRKGLELFCDALDLLAARGALQGTTVTFLGKAGRVRLDDGATFARRRADGWGVPVRLETAMGQVEALDYLRARPAIAVMPSLADNMPYTVLECLAEGIPFISTLTGGIPEMVAVEDHASVLAAAEPPALADVIERALRQGLAPARGSADPETIRNEWIAWHELLAARESSPAPPTARPLVSVCIATRNRPELLAQALDTIQGQTYAPIEVVLADDASDSPEALEILDRLAPEFATRGWQIVRRPVRAYPAATRNAAAAHAHGEYLLFMDDDNLARSNEVETFVNAALHSRVPILTCLVDHFHGEPGPDGVPTPALRWLPLGAALAVGILWNRFGDTNMLIDRDAFHRLGGFDEDRDAAFVEDWIFLSRAALAGVEMAVVPEPLFWYRVWESANGQRQPHSLTQHRRLRPYLDGESPDRRTLLLYAAGLHARVAEHQGSPIDDARAVGLALRFARAHELITIGPDDAGSLEPHRDLEISATGDGILLRSLGWDPIAWLPLCPPSSVHSIVRIEMTASRPTLFQLFWTTVAVPHPCEEHSTLVRFPSGRHVRWAEIPAAAHVGRLRLDPSFEPGDHILHSLEIRCESEKPRAALLPISGLLRRFRSDLPDLPVAERFRRAVELIEIGPGLGTVSAIRGTEISVSARGIVLLCLDQDPQVHLPLIEPNARPMVARLQVSSSIETTAQIFWATRRRPYCEEQSAAVRLTPGRNVRYVTIPSDARGRLRFDPAGAPCEVIIHSLEIRGE